jgi:hypothetical protein
MTNARGGFQVFFTHPEAIISSHDFARDEWAITPLVALKHSKGLYLYEGCRIGLFVFKLINEEEKQVKYTTLERNSKISRK